jgi:hypothetical protein
MDQPGKYFYRCYSSSSAGTLISGKGHGYGQRLGANLYAEFISHVLRPSQWEPTALISTSGRLIDTLQRAFSKFYNDKENPSQIWIAFIHVPDVDEHIYHHAEDLGRQFAHPEPGKLHYEYLFEWEIPKKYLIHTVSVQTLLNRGLNMEYYLHNGKFPNTRELLERFTSTMFKPSYSAYEIGLELGLLVRAFGARAPVCQVARQLLYDCVRRIYRDREILHDIKDGIDTALIDWWLADVDFYDAYNEHCDWASDIEDEDKIENAAIKLGL